MQTALNYTNEMINDLHPNESVYDKMAAVWFDKLDQILSDNSLPVYLTNLLASQFGDVVEIEWTTESEIKHERRAI